MTDDFALDAFDAFVFDLDGTIWLSGEALPGAAEFVARCRDLGPIVYASNLSIPHVSQVQQSLLDCGVGAVEDGCVISGMTIAMALHRDGVREAAMVTGPGVQTAVRELGIDVRDVNDIDQAEWIAHPDGRACVIAGWYDATMHELNAVGWLASHGVPLYVKTLDPGLPIATGFEPGTGMMIAAIEALYDVQYEICGKPSPIFAEAVRAHFPDATRPLMVGDSRESDVGLAELLECESLFLTRGKLAPSEVRAIAGIPTPTFAATGLDDAQVVRVARSN